MNLATIYNVPILFPYFQLPIIESIRAIYSEIEINERTEIYVRDIEMLREMANIVSSSTETWV